MQRYITRLSVWLSALYFMSMRAIADTGNPNLGNNLSSQPGVDITIQSLTLSVQALACWATQFILIVMIMVIVWYGFQMMISQGNDTKFGNAKKSLTNAVIGMIVILGAYTIIATVGNTIQAVGAQNLSQKSSNFLNYTPLHSCS